MLIVSDNDSFINMVKSGVACIGKSVTACSWSEVPFFAHAHNEVVAQMPEPGIDYGLLAPFNRTEVRLNVIANVPENVPCNMEATVEIINHQKDPNKLLDWLAAA